MGKKRVENQNEDHIRPKNSAKNDVVSINDIGKSVNNVGTIKISFILKNDIEKNIINDENIENNSTQKTDTEKTVSNAESVKDGATSKNDIGKIINNSETITDSAVLKIDSGKIVNIAENIKSAATPKLDIENDINCDNVDRIIEKIHSFALDFSLHLTMSYDIFNRYDTGVEEDVDLPLDLIVSLRGSINRYKSSRLLDEFLPIAEFDNREDILRCLVLDSLINRGNELPYYEFLRLAALYVLTAYDLDDICGFQEAPDCVLEALTEAIFCTPQREWLKLTKY